MNLHRDILEVFFCEQMNLFQSVIPQQASEQNDTYISVFDREVYKDKIKNRY